MTIELDLAIENAGGFWNLPKVEEVFYVRDGVQKFPGQIVPLERNGRYYNIRGENLFEQFFETQCLLFVGTYDPVTRLENLEETVRTQGLP